MFPSKQCEQSLHVLSKETLDEYWNAVRDMSTVSFKINIPGNNVSKKLYFMIRFHNQVDTPRNEHLRKE
jgi:hypothetical protein